jgi:hypothetical protein
MAAPWHALTTLAGCLAAYGTVGVLYSLRVLRHAREANYRPDLEDTIWYLTLPFVAHLGLCGAAILIWFGVPWSLAIVAIDVLLFLLMGVHNSWDTVTFLAVRQRNHSDN